MVDVNFYEIHTVGLFDAAANIIRQLGKKHTIINGSFPAHGEDQAKHLQGIEIFRMLLREPAKANAIRYLPLGGYSIYTLTALTRIMQHAANTAAPNYHLQFDVLVDVRREDGTRYMICSRPQEKLNSKEQMKHWENLMQPPNEVLGIRVAVTGTEEAINAFPTNQLAQTIESSKTELIGSILPTCDRGTGMHSCKVANTPENREKVLVLADVARAYGMKDEFLPIPSTPTAKQPPISFPSELYEILIDDEIGRNPYKAR